MKQFRTTAPAAYDYGYTSQIGEGVMVTVTNAIPYRVVEIPEEAANYQTARYMSGMYFVEEVIAGEELSAEEKLSIMKFVHTDKPVKSYTDDDGFDAIKDGEDNSTYGRSVLRSREKARFGTEDL